MAARFLRRWRQMPLNRRLAVGLLLWASDSMFFSSGAAIHLHGVVNALYFGVWIGITLALIMVIMAIIRDVRHTLREDREH